MTNYDKLITSQDNTLIKTWTDCLQPKGIKKHGQFLVFGERAVLETIEYFPQLARNLILDASNMAPFTAQSANSAAQALQETVDFARKQTEANSPRFSTVAVSAELFKSLDVFGTRNPILVMATPEIPEADLGREPEGLEVLCALQDPSNLGALVRSAVAFGASKIILLKESTTPFHPKAVRAASATTLAMRYARGPSIKDLPAIADKTRDMPWVALDMLGTRIDDFRWPKSARLILGEEGHGVPESRAFEFVSIPMLGRVESLNATVASSIALYSYRQKNPVR
jgi:TrmH family RNA methyltransferase